MASHRLGLALFLPLLALCLLMITADTEAQAPGEENLQKVLPFQPEVGAVVCLQLVNALETIGKG